MVCLRCKMAVEAVLNTVQIPFLSIELGRLKLPAPLSAEQQAELDKELKRYGLELMENQSKILVERVKTEIITLLRAPNRLHLKLSVHLSQALDYNYTYLANVFSEHEGITIERYFISQRVERAKELMIYEDLSLTQIADELAYSSVSRLCLQFKKVTERTPAEFKRLCQSDDFVWRPL